MKLNVFENESIHSYFIRTLLCLGQLNDKSDFRGLISPSGVIRKLPCLVARQGSAFEELTNNFFELLLTEHSTYYGLRHYNIGELRNYILYSSALPKVSEIPDAHQIPNSRTQLRYCPKCFIEQIKNKGVSWFKLDWQCSVVCTIHNDKLFHVFECRTNCCNKPSNILRDVLSAISGKCCFCSRNSWEVAQQVFIGDWNRAQYLVLENDNQYKMYQFR
ncbi:hypothetical protein PSECIP111854_01600 [Pseudoalteromonas sp. CIP111854]|uniref:TniQ domain-containing protein n=1 Tax=Pseudoalteromonas holothuriae TaxID=2963714 RepID=A0A9W4W316_9GAMM|nr:TniQ family protein [Pseudoalteromonas sp. CIP111854]CAH9055545.1 hypothetical protein PSECIP111854_01600 [Pseudoalteromonas sp. CIP111854]